MARAYSQDLRKRIIEAVKDGTSARQTSRRFGVSPSFAIKLVKRWKETGSYNPLKQGGCRKPHLLGLKEEIIELVEKHPDWSGKEYTSYLSNNHDILVHQRTVSRFLKRLGYSYKKNCFCNRTE